MRIELRIGRLVADDLDGCPQDQFVAAITQELRLVLMRELSGARPAAPAVLVPRLRTALAIPAAGATSTSAGRAIGAALGAAVTSERLFPRSGGPR
jgi:hypothetical protein